VHTGQTAITGAPYSPRRGIVVADPSLGAIVETENKMAPQRAIFVPGHGHPELVCAVRFIPQAKRGGSRPAGPAVSSTVEVWGGNYYGDLEGTVLASRSVKGQTEFEFRENERPLVPLERSLVVVIHDPPAQWKIEVDSIVTDERGVTLPHRVTIDNFGTAFESRPGVRRQLIENRAA
jgi:hypothetical protein